MGSWPTTRVFALAALCAACGQRSTVTEVENVPEQETVRHGTTISVPEASALRHRLRIETVEPEALRRSLSVPARVEADPARMAHVTAPLPGRIVHLFVRLGDTVHRDQPLLELDSPELVAAQTDWLNARAALAQAERTLLRQRDLNEHGIASHAELEQAETAEAVSQAEVERTRTRLRLLGMTPGSVGRPLTVRAPIDGRVVEFHVANGEFHSDLASPLMTIADLSVVWVAGAVQERDVSRVRVGMSAQTELAAYPGRDNVREGQVLYVGDLLDPETRTLPVHVTFDNGDGRMRPGMFARLTFEQTARPEIVIPQPALVLIGDESYVFVETAPWSFERRRIVLGDPVGDRTIVVEGLRGGERVVVANAILLAAL